MIIAILGVLNTALAPALGAILKLLFQMKVIKSEADVREIQRRFEAAIKAADQIKTDSIDAQKQYNGAKGSAEDKWKSQFGGGAQ